MHCRKVATLGAACALNKAVNSVASFIMNHLQTTQHLLIVCIFPPQEQVLPAADASTMRVITSEAACLMYKVVCAVVIFKNKHTTWINQVCAVNYELL